MRRLSVFNNVSIDGYFTDAHGDMSWAHRQDPEWEAFVVGERERRGVLLFGRITYELMASYWPTPAALEALPVVAAADECPPEGRVLEDPAGGGVGEHRAGDG